MKSTITINDLRAYAGLIEKGLNDSEIKVKLAPYFAYGSYGYYFNFENGKQLFTGLHTKKECYNQLELLFYKTLALKQYYI